MNQNDFLSEFTPMPDNVVLPQRVLAGYEADSCLSQKEDGRLTLRLRRKADGQWIG